jgi:ParB-like chromosome segregation protein Spo0J
MAIRDRIVELRRVRADGLRPNAKNWRTHPEGQRAAMRGLLAEIGYATALVARQLEDGSLELIDGHLRAETTPDDVVPVLVLDVTEKEADKLLATLDPLAAMALTDGDALARLLDRVESSDEGVAAMLTQLNAAAGHASPVAAIDRDEIRIPQLHQVVVDCGDEAEQREVYEQLRAAGRKCRLLVL